MLFHLENSRLLQCKFCPEVEKLFITNGHVSGLRKDLNGVLLLDSILQPPLRGPCLEPVVLELTLSDVSIRYKAGAHGMFRNANHGKLDNWGNHKYNVNLTSHAKMHTSNGFC